MTDQREYRYLVVVVGLLAGPGPAREIHRLSRAQPSSFHFVVPATKPDYGLTWTEEQAIDDARARLDIMLDFGRRMGLRASGVVAEADDAVEAARAAADGFDEIVLVDNPRALRRWRSERAVADLRGSPGVAIHHLRADPPLTQGRHFDAAELRGHFQRFVRDLDREDARRIGGSIPTGGLR